MIHVNKYKRGQCVYNKNDIQYGSWMRMICPDSESIIYDRHSSDILRCLSSCNARWRLIACLSLVPCGALPSHQRVKFSKQKKGWAVMPSWCVTCWQGNRWNLNLHEPPMWEWVWTEIYWDYPIIPIYSRYISWHSMMFHRVPWCSTECHDVPWCAMMCHDVPWCAMMCHDADAALQLISGPRFDREVRAAHLALHSWRCGLDLVRFRNSSSEPKPVLWSDCDKLQHTSTYYTLSSS